MIHSDDYQNFMNEDSFFILGTVPNEDGNE